MNSGDKTCVYVHDNISNDGIPSAYFKGARHVYEGKYTLNDGGQLSEHWNGKIRLDINRKDNSIVDLKMRIEVHGKTATIKTHEGIDVTFTDLDNHKGNEKR